MEIRGKKLEFDEDNHIYHIDGEKVDSVTQILKRLFPSKYSDIPAEVLKRASERGTQIHKDIECYCNGFDIGSDEVKDFKFLQKQYKFTPIETELPIILNFGGKVFAGRIDLILEMNKVYVLADIKTTSTLDKEYLAYQLNLYRLGVMQSYDYDIKELYGIHLRDGKRKLVKIPIIEEDRLLESIKEVL